MAILVILMSVIFQVIQMSSQAWKSSTQGTSTMQQARAAFERMTRNLSQATLNTYYGYYYASGATMPSYYMRQSELQFICGNGPVNGSTAFLTAANNNAVQVTHGVFFQAPLGDINSTSATDVSSYGALDRLLNACGYFVIYGPDTFRPPFFSSLSNAPQNENRFRLMEYLQPSEDLSIYTSGAIPSAGVTIPLWISNGLPTDFTAAPPASPSPVNVRPLASNIVALIILPEQFFNSSGTNPNPVANESNVSYIPCQSANSYNYDSAYHATPTGTPPTQNAWANQLPPLVKVIMVAIDEPSALRLAAAHTGASSTSPPDLGDLTTSTAALFQDPSKLFTSSSVPEGDLEKFEDVLNAKAGNVAGNTLKLNYSVFQTDVIIRSSKWSQ